MIGSPELDVTGVTPRRRARARPPRRRLADLAGSASFGRRTGALAPYDCAHGGARPTRAPSRTGLRPRGDGLLEPDDAGPLHARAASATRGRSPTAGRSSSTPDAHRPLAEGQVRRARARLRGADLVGQGQPGARGGPLRRAPREGRRATSARATSTSSTRSPAPIPGTGSTIRVVTDRAYHALFARTMFITPSRRGADRLRAAGGRPARARPRGRPGGGRHAHRHLHRAAPVAAARC